uniref:Uncharacterized protein n=1 Tax=Nothobranchius furzeri TaxID=105023 RepID=A0A1A8B011_NOTFU
MTAKLEEHTALQMALEEKRRRINHLETMKELSAAQARMQVYDQGSDIKKGVKRPISHKMAVHVKPSGQTSSQQSSIPLVPQQPLSSSSNQDTAGLQCLTKAKESRSLLERYEKFADWSRLVKAVARLKRRVAEHKRLKQRTNEGTSLEERKDAEIAIVKLVQREAFPDEIQSLKAKEGVVKTKYSKLKGLNPTLDEDGVLRGGRLNQSALHPHIKHPVILPKNSHISSLLVKHFHERIHHQGRGMTVNELRANGWWILGSTVVSTVDKAG